MRLAECARLSADEAREQMLIRAAVHVNAARVQRLLYRFYVNKAIKDATANIPHSDHTYTFVVDYGQNMELPVYHDQQPGVSYYYSLLGIYNCGIVNHAHVCENGDVREHMHAYVYHEGVGKKGANNVVSIIIKTLRDLNIMREDSIGGELNIIFDNCSDQNKNNTVLKMLFFL